MEDPSKFYNDLMGLQLIVPCKTWDPGYALKCFGEGYEERSVQGNIVKVKMNRNSKTPRFDVYFPEKAGEKMYVNFDLDYIWRYIVTKFH